MFVTRSDGLVCRVFIVFIFLHTSELPSACDGKCQKHFPSILGKVSDFSVGIPRIFVRFAHEYTMYFLCNYHKYHRDMLQLFINKNHLVDKVDIVAFPFVNMVYCVNFT